MVTVSLSKANCFVCVGKLHTISAHHQEGDLIVDLVPFLLDLRRRGVFLRIGMKRLIRHVFRLENDWWHRELQGI
jgi:hypothetical protein